MAVRVIITSQLYVSIVFRAGIEVLRENELGLPPLLGVGLLRTGVRLQSHAKHVVDITLSRSPLGMHCAIVSC